MGPQVGKEEGTCDEVSTLLSASRVKQDHVLFYFILFFMNGQTPYFVVNQSHGLNLVYSQHDAT